MVVGLQHLQFMRMRVNGLCLLPGLVITLPTSVRGACELRGRLHQLAAYCPPSVTGRS